MPAPSREQLLYWLTEAAEIEHQLMCCYLYAAFSLKRSDPDWSPPQREAVERWRRIITAVALEEMTHLCLVGNLMTALGAPPHLQRPALPVDSGPYPAGFSIRLQGFSVATIEHFMFLERPDSVELADGAGFHATGSYRRAVPGGRLSPGARDYATVGELYETIAASLEASATVLGEGALFTGDPRLQVDASLAPLPGVIAVTDLASARTALRTIVTQGEGAGSEHTDSHFLRFCRLREELLSLLAADPAFEPAWPAASNPVMNPPVRAIEDRVHVSHPAVERWLDIGNALYTTALRCLLQGFLAPERPAKAVWLAASFALMRALTPVGQGLAARPARPESALPHGGLTFTPLRGLAPLHPESAARVIAERIAQLRERAQQLPVVPVAGEDRNTWTAVIQLLDAQHVRIAELAGATLPGSGAALAVPALPPLVLPPVPAATAAESTDGADAVESVRGEALTVLFEGRRCIHSRHCVLEAPTVFLANTPGSWIRPDAVPADLLIAVAHNCPSGAIRYVRHDDNGVEAAPPVNTLHLRENGPYALRAPLVVAHRPDGLRATLCRCGQSGRKPWCDGSHVKAGFQASGEPASGATEALATRDGPLEVIPLANGPLEVRGNLEICSGTGRVVARTTEARLCRCGQSRNKPFCDLSHVAAGFTAAGD